jgi:hypothetical protein
MDWGLILAVVALVVTVIIAIRRSRSTARQIALLERQVTNQDKELDVLRMLMQSFDRLVTSYDTELESMGQQLRLTSPEKTSPVDAAAVEAERENQKAQKKLQKEEAKRIKKYMKSLEKAGQPPTSPR